MNETKRCPLCGGMPTVRMSKNIMGQPMEYADCDSKGCFLYGHDIPLYIWQDRPTEKAQAERIAALEEQLTITQHTLGLTVLAAEAERARAEKAREALHKFQPTHYRNDVLGVYNYHQEVYHETAPQAPTAQEGGEDEAPEGGDPNTSV